MIADSPGNSRAFTTSSEGAVFEEDKDLSHWKGQRVWKSGGE